MALLTERKEYVRQTIRDKKGAHIVTLTESELRRVVAQARAEQRKEEDDRRESNQKRD
jgi:hypothetical protein